MPSSSGPRNSANSNLIFALDTYDTSNCVTPLGCGGWNTSTQGLKNILTGVTSLFQNGLRVSNRTFYTGTGISYPEGSYGGDLAGLQGLYLGYNVRGGTNIYGASRSLNVYVWDNNANAWVPDSYFRGLRINGHCYDNWAGAETGWQNELNLFNGDYNIIKQAFPNSTWIIIGSHACQMFDSTTINNMVDLGAPRSTISSWTDGSAWREFVLVGKPGLGNNKAYGWAYENYTTNPAQVANMNLSVTPFNTGILDLDGTDDYINMGSLNLQRNWTLEIICYMNDNSSFSIFGQGIFATNQGLHILYQSGPRGMIFGMYANDNDYQNNYRPVTGRWYHWVFTYNHSTYFKQFYADTVLQTAPASVQNIYQGSGQFNIGAIYSAALGPANGKIAIAKMYDKVLSAAEIQNNYTEFKSRFNLP